MGVEEASLAENEPSPRELDVLKALWGLGSGSVREVHERMCPDGELAFNTIQTLLRIMEDKGLIRHRAEVVHLSMNLFTIEIA